MTILYRLLNAEDALLYVGVTDDFDERMAQHRDTQPWWDQVAQITTQEYASRRRALEAEARAIFWESPRYNVLGSTRYDVDWEAKYHAAEDEWAAERRQFLADQELALEAVAAMRDEIDHLRLQLKLASERPRTDPVHIRDLLPMLAR